MKISAYIAALVAQGLTDEAARGLAKGQASALALVDDIGLTKPLASGLVKGLTAAGLSDADAAETVRVAIAKGTAVDDLTAAEPPTTEDAVAQLEAASDALTKGKYTAADEKIADEDEDDEDGGDSEDDEDDEDEMPARGAKKGADVEAYAAIMKGAVEETSARLEAQFAAMTARLDGIAKGIGAQGTAFAQLAKGMAVQSESVLGLVKSFGQPRGPRSVQDVEVQPHPSEAAGAKRILERSTLGLQALVKGTQATDDATRIACADFQGLINSTADDATIQAAAVKLGLA